MTMPITLIKDVVEVVVYNSQAGPVLIGAIELVSPANKDRPATAVTRLHQVSQFVAARDRSDGCGPGDRSQGGLARRFAAAAE